MIREAITHEVRCKYCDSGHYIAKCIYKGQRSEAFVVECAECHVDFAVVKLPLFGPSDVTECDLAWAGLNREEAKR